MILGKYAESRNRLFKKIGFQMGSWKYHTDGEHTESRCSLSQI